MLVLKCVTFFILCVWQATALAFYILSTLFIDNFVIIFVITVLLAALDFWVVKNVSGRILVGLRWWNEINDLGESVWRFECLDQEVRIACFTQLQLACCYPIFQKFSLYGDTLCILFVFSPVIGPDQQERFMAFLVDTLPYSKKTSIDKRL